MKGQIWRTCARPPGAPELRGDRTKITAKLGTRQYGRSEETDYLIDGRFYRRITRDGRTARTTLWMVLSRRDEHDEDQATDL